LDTALYDKVKNYQRLFSEMIRLNIFNELLFEGGFDPIVNPMESNISDRCFFRFKEIDVDTQVKKETHLIQKYVNNIATLGETRVALGYEHPELDLSQLYSAIQGKVQLAIATGAINSSSFNPDNQSTSVIDTSQPDLRKNGNTEKPANKNQSLTPVDKKTAPANKGVDNTMRPANQYGKKTSPNIKRMDNQFLTTIENLLDEEYTTIRDDFDQLDTIEVIENGKSE
jgi:hypothetical protein